MRQYIHFQCWNVLLKAHFTKEPTRQVLGKQFLHHFYPWTFSEQPYCLIASSGKAKVIVKSNNKHFLSSFSPLLTSYNKLHWTFQKNGLWSLIERLSDKAGWEWWIGSRGACFTRAGWPSSPTTGWGSSPPFASPNFSISPFFFFWLALMVSRETIWIWMYFKLVGRNRPIEVPVLSIWLCWGVLLYSQAFILGSLIWRMSTFKESIEALGRDSCLLLMTPSQVTNKHHKHSGIGINVVFIGFICWVLTKSPPPFPLDYTWWLAIYEADSCISR